MRLHPGTGPLQWLLLALPPGIVVQTVVFGPGTVLNLLLCTASCVALDAAGQRLRGRTVMEGDAGRWRKLGGDGSALLTGLLLGLALPAQGPTWLPMLAAVAAMVVGKHLFAHHGPSPFNPAMVGLAILLVGVPQAMTAGLPAVDALSSATLLDRVRTGLHLQRTLGEILGGARLYEQGEFWINAAFLGGGLWLLRQRQLPWQIPLGVMAGLAAPALLLWALDTSRHPSPLFQLFSGSTMLAAFFIATAPPSSPRTAKARLVYGLGIGATIYAIRSGGAYPDGVAFAVLLFNAAAPALDRGLRLQALRWPRLAVALALALVAMLFAVLVERQRANALPALAELGIGDATVTAIDRIDDSPWGALTLYRLEAQGVPSGMILRTREPGYVGDIDVATVIDRDGRIVCVRVLHHDESRGIGDRIEAARDPWILGFSGRSAVDETTDALSGATVSAHAVRGAVGRALEYFAVHRENPRP
ncbi:MAG TPA: RnfABCDGE type electron transport complex subunit D [Fontimonas sp.]